MPESLFNKVVIKKETSVQLFSCEFFQISKDMFLTEQLQTTAFMQYQVELIRYKLEIKTGWRI